MCFSLGWTLIVHAEGLDHNGQLGRAIVHPGWIKYAITAALLLLGMLEKLCWVGNLIVMERDWVPLLASPTSKPALHTLNAGIKRIDLVSKLVAPLAISGIALAVHSLKATALLIAAMQLLTVVPEMLTASKVFRSCSPLQLPRPAKETIDFPAGDDVKPSLRERFTNHTGILRRYVNSAVFIPSIAWTLQPLSVLTLSASMTVYLLAANFPLDLITIARTCSTGVEILSTVVTPLLISALQERQRRKGVSEGAALQPLIVVGLSGLLWQLCSLAPAVVALIFVSRGTENPATSFPIWTGVLLTFLALSRLGPFAYTLVEQQLVQTAVAADRRVEFSGTEMAMLSFAELCRWSLTGIFGKPEQFKGVALFSFGAIMGGTIMFGLWSRHWKERLQTNV